MPDPPRRARRLLGRVGLGLLGLVVGLCFARVLWREVLSGAGGGDGEVVLTVMHWSGDAGQEEDAILRAALERYEREHPGVRVRRINPGDAPSYYTKLQTMLAAGEPPDVFYLGAERLATFARLGLLRSLQDRVERDARELDLEDFYPATVDAYRWDGERAGRGELYGVPKDFTTIGFYYNRDLFRRAGVPEPADDWTWDDFLAAARAVGGLEGCTGAEFVTWPTMVRLYLRTEGLDVGRFPFESLDVQNPQVVATLERLAAWRRDEPRTLTSGKSKVATGATVFLRGDVGMAGPFGRWVVPSYRQIEDFDWDFAPMPRGREHANVVATVAWALSSSSRHPEEGWDLIRALTDREAQDGFARLGLAIPTRRSVAESDAFLDPELPPSRDRVFLDEAEVAQVLEWPANPKFESLLETRLNQGIKTCDLSVDEACGNFAAAWALEGTSPLARGDFPSMPWGRIVDLLVALLLVLLGILWLHLRRTRPGPLARAEERSGWLLVSPLVLGMGLFLAFPVGLSLLLGFARWNGVSGLEQARWVGLANYAQLLGHDGRFLVSLRVTAFYALLAVPLGQGFALGAALLMNTRLWGIGLFRAAWYLPSVLAGVGVAVLWRWVFDGDNGLLNALLARAGLAGPDWFGSDAAWAGAPAFALLNLWMVGGAMMIYLAGLKGVPQELYEAAELDGAGAWDRFRHITLPMLSPVVLFNGIMAVIASFQVFTQAFVMTGGEPGDLTRFYVLYLYNQAFEFYEMGYASAMAWLLLVVVLALTLVTLRLSRRHVHYEALS